ncbi:MAG TPA: hypothetical protein DCY88_21270 [Cyanobacteria bacterium UBA11372]|nr:hypothetical protein [Cyanobacteria bacterium UBA11372]
MRSPPNWSILTKTFLTLAAPNYSSRAVSHDWVGASRKPLIHKLFTLKPHTMPNWVELISANFLHSVPDPLYDFFNIRSQAVGVQ